MKKILLSFAIILVVGGIVWGATKAFYNDTETSNGNIFTAGSIDLKVDHLAQTYNGDDCETCSLTLHSGDGGAMVTDASSNAVLYPIVSPFSAPLVTPTTITQQYWTTLPGASWIWATDPIAVGDDGSNGDVTYTFEQKFNWWGGAVNVNLSMNVAADNQYEIFLNGTSIATGVGSAQYTSLDSVAQGVFLAQVHPGENTLTFIVTNLAQDNSAYNTPLYNPGGLLYYLTVERDPEDCDANSEFQQACQLWTETDLDGSQKFFSFGDIKPKDEGTNLISLHVSSNDAYVCLLPQVTNDENGVVEPELSAGDNASDGVGNGELQDQIEFFGWDDNGDGVYQNGEGILIPAGTSLVDIQANMVNMSLSTTSTGYIGLAWCAGTQTVTGSTIDCDGNGMSDIVQTDKAMADLVAYAVQQRNNENFSCADVQLIEN